MGKQADGHRVQVLGLLRFSYPSVYNGKGIDDFDAYRQSLYEPARLHRRLVWFEHVVLPSLRKQADPDFECILLMGDQLPEPFNARLMEMVATVPQITLAVEPEGQRHRLAVKALMEKYSDPNADVVAEFQLDDDDAVAEDFVARTRAMYSVVHPMMAEHGRVTLDFCHGLMLRVGVDGHDVKPVLARLWTPALVTYRFPEIRTVLRIISHLDLWERMPTLSIEKPLMFVRGAHEDNVSNFAKRWDHHGVQDQKLGDVNLLLAGRFGIDLETLQRERAALG